MAELLLGLLQHERADAGLFQRGRESRSAGRRPRPGGSAGWRRQIAATTPKSAASSPTGVSPEPKRRSNCVIAPRRRRPTPRRASPRSSWPASRRTDWATDLGRDRVVGADQQRQLGQLLVEQTQLGPDHVDEHLGRGLRQFDLVDLLGPGHEPLARAPRRSERCNRSASPSASTAL